MLYTHVIYELRVAYIKCYIFAFDVALVSPNKTKWVAYYRCIPRFLCCLFIYGATRVCWSVAYSLL